MELQISSAPQANRPSQLHNNRKRMIVMPYRSKKRVNNKGFSLVEVMLSIVILAMISVATVNYFVQSKQQNARANDNQGAMVAGQSIMEQVKTKTVKELWLTPSFEEVTSDGVPVGAASFIPHPVGPGTEPYYFLTKNISVDGTKYDAFVTLDQNAFTAQNNEPIPELPEVAGSNVVTIVQSMEDDNAVNSFYNIHLNDYFAQTSDPLPEGCTLVTRDFIRDNITKIITVKIDQITDPSDASKVYAKVNVTYTYRPTSNEAFWKVSNTTEVTQTMSSINVPLTSGTALPVYLFYRPLPNSGHEKVVVDNLIPEMIDFNLVCQKDALGNLPPSGYYVECSSVGVMGPVQFHSNVSRSSGVAATNDLTESVPRQRLFGFRIEVYKSGGVYDGSNVLARFDSTKGVWDDES